MFYGAGLVRAEVPPQKKNPKKTPQKIKREVKLCEKNIQCSSFLQMAGYKPYNGTVEWLQTFSHFMTYLASPACNSSNVYLGCRGWGAEGFSWQTLASNMGPPANPTTWRTQVQVPYALKYLQATPLQKYVQVKFPINCYVARWPRGSGDGHWPQFWDLPQIPPCG